MNAQRVITDLRELAARTSTPEGAQRVTVARFTLPTGEDVQGRGVRPDVDASWPAALESMSATEEMFNRG